MPEPSDAASIIRELGLQPHPEGGHYRETFRDSVEVAALTSGATPGATPGGGDQARGASTAIYYLLQAGEISHWHRVDATEVWHWYGGAALELTVSEDGREALTHRLGPDLAAGERPQVVVPAGAWQGARSLGAWTLTGCTVAPAFRFEGFKMAPPDWQPLALRARKRGR